MIDEKQPRCPACGSDHVDRVEVDIGVGTQCGPWDCYDCGWQEGEEPPFSDFIHNPAPF